jgi:hypothetical protein
MQLMNRGLPQSQRRGMALVSASLAAFTAAAMVSVVMVVSLSNNHQSQVDRHNIQARYTAEGALASATKSIQEAVANWKDVPETGMATLNGQEIDYTITTTGLSAIATDSSGIQTLIDGYEIVALGESGRSHIPMHKIINVESTPIFQFAVFYTNDLEIFPGPSMTLGGRVHTNADMYIGCGNTLTVDTNYMAAVGKIYRERKDNPGVSAGTVKVRRWVENPYDASEPEEYEKLFSQSQMLAEGITTTSGYDSAFTDGVDLNGDGDFYDAGEWLPWGPGALDFWSEPMGYAGGTGNTVLNEAHAVGEAEVPAIGSISMFEESNIGNYELDPDSGVYVQVAMGTGTHSKGFFHEHADLTVITYADGSWDAFDGGGFSIKASLLDVVSVSSIYDARQADGSGDDTPVTTIDIDKLNSSGAFPSNGLLYAAHYGMGTGTDAKGIVLTEGEELDAALTVVSEGPLYVHGDFNTVSKKGASVIGDAVNLLSNKWDGSKSPGDLPKASTTTFNMAIVTGNHETFVSKYNGGLENLPRFHEKWKGINCFITGSFVNTWESQYATAKWRYGGDRYKAPKRKWRYDEDFNQVVNLPPFTPMAVTANDVVTW